MHTKCKAEYFPIPTLIYTNRINYYAILQGPNQLNHHLPQTHPGHLFSNALTQWLRTSPSANAPDCQECAEEMGRGAAEAAMGTRESGLAPG